MLANAWAPGPLGKSVIATHYSLYLSPSAPRWVNDPKKLFRMFHLFWTAGLSAIATHHRLYLTITITICSKVVGQRPKATISDVSTVLDSWTICHCHPLTPSGQRIARRETTSRLPLLYNPFYSIPFNIIWYGMAQGSTNCGARHFI